MEARFWNSRRLAALVTVIGCVLAIQTTSSVSSPVGSRSPTAEADRGDFSRQLYNLVSSAGRAGNNNNNNNRLKSSSSPSKDLDVQDDDESSSHSNEAAEAIRQLMLQRQAAALAAEAELLEGTAPDGVQRPDQLEEDGEDRKKKRGDARRCFYHAVNCW